MLLIQSGIGPDKARKTTQQLLADGPWNLIISTGFAGDLKADSIGSVLIGHEVVFGQTAISPLSSTSQIIACHPDWINVALAMSGTRREPLKTGRFVSVDHVLTNSEDKHLLHAESGAVGVDMESAAIGEIAQENGFPFLIVRAISDGANENLPVDFNLFLTPSGWVSGVLHIMTTPKSWKGFFDLYRHSKQASRQLTNFFEEFFSSVSKMRISSTSLSRKF